MSHLCTVLFELVFSRIRRSRRSTSFKLTELEEYSGCPLLRRDARSSIGFAYAKNLERGEGGVWLNWILKKLLSRLSVFSGACTPFLFFVFLAGASFVCHFFSCWGAPTACSAARRSGAPAPPCFSYERPETELSQCLLLRCLCCWRCCCFDCCLCVAATLSPLLFSSQVVKSHMPVTKVFSVVDASGDVVGPPAGGVGGVKSHLCTVLF